MNEQNPKSVAFPSAKPKDPRLKLARLGKKSSASSEEREEEEVESILASKRVYKEVVQADSQQKAQSSQLKSEIKSRTTKQLKNTSVNIRLESMRALHNVKGNLIGTEVDLNFRIVIEWGLDKLKLMGVEKLVEELKPYQSFTRKTRD